MLLYNSFEKGDIMEIINFTQEKFNSIEKILLNGVFHSEGEIYRFGDAAIKKLYRSNGLYFSNKLYTINSLIDERESLYVDGLVFPDKLLSIDERAFGYIMPFISGDNLGNILKDERVSITQKIDFLKQIGKILAQMAGLRDKNGISNFFLNDLHENNFIVDENGKVHAIDLDSCSVFANSPFGTKYVTIMSPLKDYLEKYKLVEEYSCGGEFVPSMDTDLYCYCIMILNLFFNRPANKYSVETFRELLDLMRKSGLSQELYEIFNNLYSNQPNINPYLYLDNLDETYTQFQKIKHL